jgi:DNA-binding transcriptional LysR family regulator
MNDLQIEYFLAAARNMSFSKAAQELYVSQPAISRQILSLEQELGCPLFERLNKGIVLTANGEMFYDFFDRCRGELFDLKLRAKLSLEKKNRILHLGVLNNWNISEIILPVLKAFSEEYPDVKVEINSYEPRGSQEALQAGKEDIILTIEPKILNIQGILYEKLIDLPRVLIYNSSIAGQKKEELTPFDFRDEEFLTVSGEDYDYVTDLIRSVCQPYGFTPRIQPVHSTDAMIMGVQCGLGVAVTDIWSRALDNAGFRYLLLASTHPLSLVWKNEQSDAVISRFVEMLRESIFSKAGGIAPVG